MIEGFTPMMMVNNPIFKANNPIFGAKLGLQVHVHVDMCLHMCACTCACVCTHERPIRVLYLFFLGNFNNLDIQIWIIDQNMWIIGQIFLANV